MNEKFINRLTKLRMAKGVSARDMSLSLGQNPGYINNIENGKNLPSMMLFFYICEYLELTPAEFFDYENSNPARLNEVIADLKKLTPEKLEHISKIIIDMK